MTFSQNSANRPPEVAPFSLNKSIAIERKKIKNSKYVFELTIQYGRNPFKAPKKIFFKYYVTHYFLGNFMLNSKRFKKNEN